MRPLVTILVPCYNQPELLRRCLESIRTQTFTEYTICIVDDFSTILYETVINDFPELEITYKKNKTNLGAVPNMIACLKLPVVTPYKMVFHEDDVMYPDLLSNLISALRETNAGWAGSRMSFFSHQPVFLKDDLQSKLFFDENNSHELIKMLLTGAPLSLGSVLYRSEVAEKAKFDLTQFSVLGDRAMLIELSKQYGSVFLNYHLIAAYNHHTFDNRWRNLKKLHVTNYFNYLVSFFNRSQLYEKEIISGFTRTFIDTFKLLPKTEQKGKLLFFMKALDKGIISIKYLLLHNSSIRKLGTRIKRTLNT